MDELRIENQNLFEYLICFTHWQAWSDNDIEKKKS